MSWAVEFIHLTATSQACSSPVGVWCGFGWIKCAEFLMWVLEKWTIQHCQDWGTQLWGTGKMDVWRHSVERGRLGLILLHAPFSELYPSLAVSTNPWHSWGNVHICPWSPSRAPEGPNARESHPGGPRGNEGTCVGPVPSCNSYQLSTAGNQGLVAMLWFFIFSVFLSFF